MFSNAISSPSTAFTPALATAPVSSNSYKNIDYPYLPPPVEVKHIQNNGLLVSDADVERIANILSKHPDGHYKNPPSISYDIIKQDNQLYAIYNNGGAEVKIGEGGFGEVQLAQNLTTGKWYALKIQLYRPSGRAVTCRRECQILHRLGKSLHEYPLECCFNQNGESFFKGYIFAEYERGLDLTNFFNTLYAKYRSCPDLLMLKIANAFLEQHLAILNAGIIHRDIKFENIMLSLEATMMVAIVDFGLALPCNTNEIIHPVTTQGTPHTLAPECQTKKPEYSEKSEVYSAGVVVQMLLKRCDSNNRLIKSYNDSTLPSTLFYQVPAVHQYINNMIAAKTADRPLLADAVRFFKSLETSYEQTHKEEKAQIDRLLNAWDKRFKDLQATAYQHVTNPSRFMRKLQ